MKIFSGLNFAPVRKEPDRIVCTIPGWRHDLYREADLIEEAARCYGYHQIPVEQKIHIEVAPVDCRQKTALKIRTYLNGCGFFETVNVTFVDNKTAELFSSGPIRDSLAVGDVSRKNANLLRQNLFGSLLGVMQFNYNAGNIPCRLYELADTFLPSSGPQVLPDERPMLGLAGDCDFQTLRGILEGLIERLSFGACSEFSAAEYPWAQASARIYLRDTSIGFIGQLKTEISHQFDLDKGPVCAAQLDLASLISVCAGALPAARPLPRFPSVTRDLSLVLDEPVPWSAIEQAVRQEAPGELEQIQFAGLYRGKPIPAGKKSLTVSLRFRDEDGTLRHEQVDEFERAILARLKTKFAAELRTA